MKRFVKLTISLVVWSIDWLYKKIQKRFGGKYINKCVVLYYHGITAEDRNRFARQLDDLVRFTKPISLEVKELLDAYMNYSAVTFDDGFESIIENALPELAKRGIPVIIFVPSGCLGKKPGWIRVGNDEQNQETVMTDMQLRDLDTNLISIGSHCVTHRKLILLSEDEAKKEIFESKHSLEDLLSCEVNTLSFPHGAFTNKHIQWAQEAGYIKVFSISPRLAFQQKEEYIIGRIRVDPTDWQLEFCLKILGAYRWLPAVYSLKRNIREYLYHNKKKFLPFFTCKKGGV